MKELIVSVPHLAAAICEEVSNQVGGDVPPLPELMDAAIEAAYLVEKKVDGLQYEPLKGESSE